MEKKTEFDRDNESETKKEGSSRCNYNMIWPMVLCHSQMAAVIDGQLWEYEVTSWRC